MSKITPKSVIRILFLGLSLVVMGGVSAGLYAQSSVTGAIAGQVTDPQGAVLPNATVSLRNVGTARDETATTGPDGRYRFGNLQPGIYNISITASGFGEYKREQIIVEVGRITTTDAKMSLTAASASVDIVAEASLVNTESKEFTSNVNQTSINELPINGRRWSNFAILAPGSVPDGSFGLISFRGISGLLNNNTIDGGDNNQAFFSEERGRTRISYSVSQSAIREFQVNTSNYSAEYGRAAGGVTNAVTKSGTNELHGDVFYFRRDNSWGARNPLAFQSILDSAGNTSVVGIKPEDVRNQYGGTLGGPLIKNKLFFFFSWDQQLRNFPGLGIFTSPTYLSTVNRTTLKAAPRNLTDAQIDSTLQFINSLTGVVPRRGDQLLALPKLDWQINSKNSFTINYNRLRWDSPAGIQTQATNTRGRASFGDDFVKIDWANARLTTTITPNILNEFRTQIARDFEFEFSQTPLAGEPRTGLNASAPDVFLTNGLEFGKPTFLERPKYPEEKRKQFADTVTWSRGGNTLKFGVDINKVHTTLLNLRNESGAYSYNNINDFIVDYVNWKTPLATTATCATSTRLAGRCYTSNYAQGFGPQGFEMDTTDYGYFAQYDWKFLPRITINLGVRYEYQALPAAIIPNASTAAVPNTDLTVNQATSFIPKDKNNWGPRVGFAADLTGDGRTSLRGGYGIYYGRIINSTVYNALINTGNPAGQAQVSLAATNALAPIFPNVLTSAPAGTGAIQYFSPKFGSPMIHQADVIFERQIMKNTSVSASYLLSLGRQLPAFVDRNLSAPTTTQSWAVTGGPYDGQTVSLPVFATTRPNTSFAQLTEISSVVSSEYHAMVLQFNRRFSGGLQFNINYTLSKAVDNNQQSVTFTANNTFLNSFDPRADKGRSNYDRRNKFVANMVYAPRVKGTAAIRALADGWSIAPVFQYYTGLPYTGVVSGSNGGAGSLNRSGGENRFPGLARNTFTGPNVWNLDLRISRRFHWKEKLAFEVLGEAFNIANRTQITGINSTMYNLISGALQYNTNFGTITEAGGTLYRERQIQIGFRVQF